MRHFILIFRTIPSAYVRGILMGQTVRSVCLFSTTSLIAFVRLVKVRRPYKNMRLAEPCKGSGGVHVFLGGRVGAFSSADSK